jgi:hypothetical protein
VHLSARVLKSSSSPDKSHAVCCYLLLQNEVCFVNGGEQASCCTGYTCTPDSSVKVETSLAEKVMGGVPGVCKKVSATLSA